MPLMPEEAPTAGQVSQELTKLRWRGLNMVDGSSKQPVREVPCLEAMARRALADSGGPVGIAPGRSGLLVGFLNKALDAYAASGQPDAVDFIRPLFFDPRPGMHRSAGELLDAARRATSLNEDAFKRRRQAVFLEFAGFLINRFPTAAPATTAPVDVPDSAALVTAAPALHTPSAEPDLDATDLAGPGRAGRRRWGWLIGVAAAGTVVVLGAALALTRGGNDPGGAAPTSAAASSAAATSAAGPPAEAQSAGQDASTSIEVLGAGGDQHPPVILTFDSLGGTSSTYISVFPGVTDSAADADDDGTYPHGETRTAICQTTGRTVTSDTGAGEQPRSSNVWILIDGTPGTRQYASLTYARIDDTALAALPACP